MYLKYPTAIGHAQIVPKGPLNVPKMHHGPNCPNRPKMSKNSHNARKVPKGLQLFPEMFQNVTPKNASQNTQNYAEASVELSQKVKIGQKLFKNTPNSPRIVPRCIPKDHKNVPRNSPKISWKNCPKLLKIPQKILNFFHRQSLRLCTGPIWPSHRGITALPARGHIRSGGTQVGEFPKILKIFEKISRLAYWKASAVPQMDICVEVEAEADHGHRSLRCVDTIQVESAPDFLPLGLRFIDFSKNYHENI